MFIVINIWSSFHQERVVHLTLIQGVDCTSSYGYFCVIIYIECNYNIKKQYFVDQVDVMQLFQQVQWQNMLDLLITKLCSLRSTTGDHNIDKFGAILLKNLAMVLNSSVINTIYAMYILIFLHLMLFLIIEYTLKKRVLRFLAK